METTVRAAKLLALLQKEKQEVSNYLSIYLFICIYLFTCISKSSLLFSNAAEYFTFLTVPVGAMILRVINQKPLFTHLGKKVHCSRIPCDYSHILTLRMDSFYITDCSFCFIGTLLSCRFENKKRD